MRSRDRVSLCVPIVLAVLIAGPAIASAGTVKPGDHTLYGASVWIKSTSSMQYPDKLNLSAGLNVWSDMTVTDVPGLGNSFQAFSFEFQTVNETGTFNFWDDLTDAPTAEDDDIILGFSDVDLSDQKVTDLRRLFGNHYSSVIGATSNAEIWYAAFQVAIWEIVYENEKSGSGHEYDIYEGDVFFMTSFVNANKGLMSLAEGFLEDVNDGTGPLMQNLAALVSMDNQDMLVVVVPTPTASLAGAALLAGLLTVHRIRRRRARIL